MLVPDALALPVGVLGRGSHQSACLAPTSLDAGWIASLLSPPASRSREDPTPLVGEALVSVRVSPIELVCAP